MVLPQSKNPGRGEETEAALPPRRAAARAVQFEETRRSSCGAAARQAGDSFKNGA